MVYLVQSGQTRPFKPDTREIIGLMPPKRKLDSEYQGDEYPASSAPKSPLKRSKKQKASDSSSGVEAGPVEEKRAARYKAKCPKNIRERVERVFTQRCEVNNWACYTCAQRSETISMLLDSFLWIVNAMAMNCARFSKFSGPLEM